MATASQKMTEIKFFVLMRGALTPPPTMLVPVVWIPLELFEIKLNLFSNQRQWNVQCGSDHRQCDGHTNANGCPHERRCFRQEPANADAFSLAGEDMVQNYFWEQIQFISKEIENQSAPSCDYPPPHKPRVKGSLVTKNNQLTDEWLIFTHTHTHTRR